MRNIKEIGATVLLAAALMAGPAAAQSSFNSGAAADRASSLGGEFRSWSYGTTMGAQAFARYIEHRYNERAYQWSIGRHMWQVEHAWRENAKRRWAWIRPTRDCSGCHSGSAGNGYRNPGSGQPSRYSDSH